jgi:hypothetical protein
MTHQRQHVVNYGTPDTLWDPGRSTLVVPSAIVNGLRRLIGQKRREQFELDCLLQALNDRFFPALATRSNAVRCFDIEITPHGRCWRIRIPEIDGLIKAGSRDQAEMLAREHIAVSIAARIAEVAVRAAAGRNGLEEPTESPGFGAGQA